MNLTTAKILALVVATSVLTSLCTGLMIKRMVFSPGGFMAQQSQGAMEQQWEPQLLPSDPQELATLEKKVKNRQGVKETANEITIDLKSYVNCKLTDPLADDPGGKEELELVGGTHALRCTSQSVPPMLNLLQESPTELAWMGSNPYLKKNNPGAALHIFRTTFDNPRPGAQVTSIDYLSTMVNPGPFLAGITLE